MCDRIHGILEHFRHTTDRLGERLIVRQLVHTRQQSLDSGELQILDQIGGGTVWRACQHERFGAQPP